ncbi:MAG: DoxX family protein [Bryobacterales bacterium]|nr:DoxX family protein [Bryobacterales bacterium]
MEWSFPGQLWVGRVLSGIAVAFLLFDALGKLMELPPVVAGTVKLGYPASSVFPLGVILLIGVVLYVFPQTSAAGAIFLAAYLGGAVATHFRVGNPLATHVLFPVYVAGFLWAGLALRKPWILAFLPVSLPMNGFGWA